MARERKPQDLSKIPVQVSPCATCPFVGGRSVLAPESQRHYTQKIVNLESQHLCHTSENQKICRGGRNIMLKVLTVLGAIAEPTDQAFDLARDEALEIKQEEN
jgi:hypothetical protein